MPLSVSAQLTLLFLKVIVISLKSTLGALDMDWLYHHLSDLYLVVKVVSPHYFFTSDLGFGYSQ